MLALVLCLLTAACSEFVPPPVPSDADLPAVSRQIIFTVDNATDGPVRFVPKRTVDGVQVGFTTPDLVPPLSRIALTLTVPTHEGWALYMERLNRPGSMTLFMYGGEFLGCSGEVPLEISLDADGGYGSSLNGNMC
jgi:hypothetical protein